MGANGAPGREEPAAADGPSPTIRAGRDADAGAVARLHAGRITDGFLSFLGPGFLTRLYRRILRHPSSFLLVAEDAGRVTGFVAGSDDVRALYRSFLLHDGIAAAVSAAPRIVAGRRQVVETLRHGSGDGVGTGRGTELLAIAVDPGHERRGVGGALVDAFLTRVATTGRTAAYVVVGADNAGAIALYTRADFVPGGEFELHAGTRSLLLQFDVASRVDGDGGDA